MNDKKTNYFVAIMNAIAIVAYIILVFTAQGLTETTTTVNNEVVNIFENNIVEFFLANIKTILLVLGLCLSISNIVNAIQNKTNKKLCFWQIIFGIIILYWTITGVFEYELPETILTLIFTIIPIIFAIKNLICIRKNKPSKIKIISYILVIVLMIVLLGISLYEVPYYMKYELSDEISLIQVFTSGWLFWSIISTIMQFIYSHKQEKYTKITIIKKIINIFVHYIVQGITVIVFAFLVFYSVITTKWANTKWENQVSEICQSIARLQSSTMEEIYYPVVNNEKYGFINESGQEKISCEYDKVTFFSEIQLNSNIYYVAFAQQGEDYYIISK